MTEGEKRCGLSSLLPMSCRGRAEAFARRLHSRLRSLGSEDDSSSCASENSWLTTNEISNPAVTSLQPRHTIDNEIFMDFGIDFDSPGSPEEEEVPESELTKFITNPKDDLHITNLDECNCMKIPGNSHPGNRCSVDSDSSDGPYFDPENIDVDNNCTFSNHINGISPNDSTASTSQVSKAEVINFMPSDIASSSECTVSSLSRTVSDEPIISLYEDSLTDTIAEDSFVPALETQSTSGWKLTYEPKSNGNNNVYGAIDLESLKCNSVNSHVDEKKLIIDDDLTDTRNDEKTIIIDDDESRRIVDEEERQRLVDDDHEYQRLVDDEGSRRYIDDEVATNDKESETILYNEDTKILVKDDEENRRLIENEETQLFDHVEDKVIIEDEQQQSIIDNEKSRDDGEQTQILLSENQDKKEPCSNENLNYNLQTEKESYCSHLNIQQNLTVEWSNSISCTTPLVQISTLEIKDSTDHDCNEESVVSEEISKSENKNNLRVSSSPIQNETEENEMEDRIPRVRRCSSLKTGKTPPGTPGRKKIVRFADVLGLDLADVRTFLDEIPKVPTSAYDDLSDADLSLSLSDSSLSSAAPSINILYTSTKTFVPLFQQPGGEPNFFDKVRDLQVCLENAVVQDSEVPCICGTVRVRNLDFNKSVHIRYSIDAWKSFADLQATYLNNSCDGFSDKFSFTLYVHTLTVGQRIDFAVRFQCKGCQYWDNNDGQNYSFQCLPTCTNTSYLPIIAPDDRIGAAFY